MIRPVVVTDRDAIAALWAPVKADLGPFAVVWHRYWSGHPENERFDVLVDGTGLAGFVHWRARRDGWRTVYEVAVRGDARGRGLGRALMDHVGHPVRLKTNTENGAARAFYERLGLRSTGEVPSKNGRRMLVRFETQGVLRT